MANNNSLEGKDLNSNSNEDDKIKEIYGWMLNSNKLVKSNLTNKKCLMEIKVTLIDGRKIFHHELKNGDIIIKNEMTYVILNIDEKGHLTENTKTGDYYYTFSKDYDKEFKHNEYDRNKKAEKGDIVVFEYNGRNYEREVLQNHPDGAVIRINKNDELVIVKHGAYKFTGKKSQIIKFQNP